MSRKLKDIGQDLGETHFLHKSFGELRGTLRDEFFKAASKAIKTPARKTAKVPADMQTPDGMLAWVLRYHHGWNIVENKKYEQVVLEADPDWQPYSIVIPFDEPYEVSAPTKTDPERTVMVQGYVIKRQITSGSAMIDVDRLKKANPTLYEDVTDWPFPLPYLVRSGAVTGHWLIKAGIEKQVKDDLTAAQVQMLLPYTYNAPGQVKLIVTYAAPDELGEG